MAGMVLGFVFPRGAWRWALALAIYVPVAVLFKIQLTPSGAHAWCPQQLVSSTVVDPDAVVLSRAAWMLFIPPFIAVYAGVATDWIISAALRWLEFLQWHVFKYVKPALRVAAVSLGVFIVAGAGLLLAQPFQPYELGERYC